MRVKAQDLKWKPVLFLRDAVGVAAHVPGHPLLTCTLLERSESLTSSARVLTTGSGLLCVWALGGEEGRSRQDCVFSS